jgi:hypothetical protein
MLWLEGLTLALAIAAAGMVLVTTRVQEAGSRRSRRSMMRLVLGYAR